MPWNSMHRLRKLLTLNNTDRVANDADNGNVAEGDGHIIVTLSTISCAHLLRGSRTLMCHKRLSIFSFKFDFKLKRGSVADNQC